MAVLEEIIDWAGSLALWQQEAIRILLLKESINEEDFNKIAILCKEENGILPQSELKKIKPLTSEEFPSITASKDEVKLLSLDSVQNVNILDKKSSIKFIPNGLTIVYGDNGAGKSSYSRVIKSATRSRGQNNKIIPNIHLESPSTPKANITYSVNGENVSVEWKENEQVDSRLSAVSFFDADCAEQYVQKENSVAYLPFGLDLFDKLSSVTDSIKRLIEQEELVLKGKLVEIDFAYPDTEAKKYLDEVLSGTRTIDDLKKYSDLSEAEKKEVRQLNQKIAVFNEKDKVQQIKALHAKNSRITNLNSSISKIGSIIKIGTLEEYFKTKKTLDGVNKSINILTQEASKDGVPALGENAWMNLWQAAKEYSEKHVHIGEAYPSKQSGARCVLCFQVLDGDAAERLSNFEKYVNNKLKEQQQTLIKDLKQKEINIQNVIIGYSDWENLSKELPDTISSKVDKYFEDAFKVKNSMLQELKSEDFESNKFSFPDFPTAEITAESKRIDEEIASLEKNLSEKEHSEFKIRLNELIAREYLQKILPSVSLNMKLQSENSKLHKCATKLNTASITRKGMELTKKHITEKLCKDFESQLEKLKVGNIKVKMVQKEGRKGVVYHEIQLESTRGEIKVGDIASDGEQRGVAIAGFLSELSTADHKSSIVFDDPVSSLDHKNRDSIAKRLVEEAKDRQVIVFTHDMFFVMLLIKFAEENDTVLDCYEIANMGGVAGINLQESPWMTLKVKKRLSIVEEKYFEVKKFYEEKKVAEYREKAKILYGLLRETWEQAVEEVLFAGSIRRFEKPIHTKQIREVLPEDIKTLEKNMTRCSELFYGHDNSPHDNGNFPEPSEIKKDIDELRNWIKQIHDRRKN